MRYGIRDNLKAIVTATKSIHYGVEWLNNALNVQ